MNNRQDAYGQMVYEYWKGNSSIREIVERDDGYVDAGGGPHNYFAPHRKWPVCERKALRFARGRLLDVGCGAGRCLLHFQEKGLEAVGIDNSPLAIRVCRERGAKRVYLRSLTQVGSDLGMFDTIIMMGNNFGLLGGRERARRLLRRFFRLTSGRGRLIAESLNPYDTTFPEHLEYHRLNSNRGRTPGQLRIRIRFRKYATPWFDYLLVSPDEMSELLVGTGWKLVHLFQCPGPLYTAVIEKEYQWI